MLFAPFHLLARVAQRFQAERCAQTAAALSFTTVLGLVPMIAGAVALLTVLPFGNGLGLAVEKFLLANLLPDKAGAVIARYVAQFAHKTHELNLLGIGVLAATALAQMLTIEHSFNLIWRIKQRRPFWRRLVMHTIALLLGPLAFGLSLGGLTYLIGAWLGLVEEPHWITAFLLRAVPFMFMVLLFALLYWMVPNHDVSKRHAALGGVFSAAGFAGMQKLFSAYLSVVPTYSVVYGTFSAIPIFLLWLYLSWTVILVGALFVAELPRSSKKP